MTDTSPSKRRLSTSGELVIGAFLGAILGWPITKALDGWAAENKLPWTAYLLGSVVGIAVVLLLMSFFIKAWRTAVWGWGGRLARWLWESRPVSHRQHLEALKELRASVTQDVKDIASSTARKALNEKRSLDTSIQQLVTRQGAPEGSSSPSSAATPKKPPLPEPRWRIERVESDSSNRTFELFNSVERSVALEVRVDDGEDWNGQPNGVAFILEDGHFQDLSGKASGQFRADFSQEARYGGGSLQVSWYDENAEKQYEYVRVPGWEKRPPRSDGWTVKDGVPDIMNPKETPF